MLRGINRQDIFEDDEDYRQMTGCLRSLTERYDEMITSARLCRFACEEPHDLVPMICGGAPKQNIPLAGEGERNGVIV